MLVVSKDFRSFRKNEVEAVFLDIIDDKTGEKFCSLEWRQNELGENFRRRAEKFAKARNEEAWKSNDELPDTTRLVIFVTETGDPFGLGWFIPDSNFPRFENANHEWGAGLKEVKRWKYVDPEGGK